MRELKFRVWNKATKSWLNETAGTHCWSEYSINIFTGEIVEFVTGDNKFFSRADEPSFYFDKTVVVKESPYVIQQYTGLKDKNGVDIYEGDILYFEKQEGVWTDQIGKCEVRFPFVCGNSHLGKIVGNIFETPNY
jgi:uncharacterized phage protein (TIGR01671 family)